MTHDEMIAVIQAHKEGKAVQIRFRPEGKIWYDAPLPDWHFPAVDYRVKPEPKVSREFCITVDRYGNVRDGHLITGMKGFHDQIQAAIHVREVLE